MEKTFSYKNFGVLRFKKPTEMIPAMNKLTNFAHATQVKISRTTGCCVSPIKIPFLKIYLPCSLSAAV